MDSLTIFENFALVCKKFHNLTLDSSAVKNINLFNIKTSETYKSAMKVLKRSKNLHRVHIENCWTYCNYFLIQIFKSSPKLKYLNIDTITTSNYDNWFKISNTAKKLFGKNLETLALGNVALDENQEDLMTEILSQKNLKTLHISLFESNIINKFLNLLPKNCQKLSKITFGSIFCDDLTQVQLTFDNFFREMSNNLKTLKVDQIVDSDNYLIEKWEQILTNLNLCQNLEVLEILDATYITNTTLTMISKLPNLKQLSFGKLGPDATELDNFFKQINSEKLEYLYIDGSEILTEEILQTLFDRTLPNLEAIWFSNCPNLKIQESTLKNLKKCPKLGRVGFEWSNLSGVSTQFLREFNEQISVYFFIQNCWYDLGTKLNVDYYTEILMKMFEGTNFKICYSLQVPKYK